jgi:uncharacterized RDD family membrane protein YckC
MTEVQGAPLASFPARAAAFLVDLFLAFVLFGLVAFPIAIVISRRLQRDIAVEFTFHAWYSLLFLVLYFGLSTWLGNGRSPGKRLLRIRVVSLVHRKLSLWQCIERALGYGASTLEAGFGFLQYFIHPNARTVHDRIADTIVVREPRQPRSSPPRPA